MADNPEEAADRMEEAYRSSLRGTLRNFVVGLIRSRLEQHESEAS